MPKARERFWVSVTVHYLDATNTKLTHGFMRRDDRGKLEGVKDYCMKTLCEQYQLTGLKVLKFVVTHNGATETWEVR